MKNLLLTPDSGLYHFRGNKINLNIDLLKNKSGIYVFYNPLTKNYYIGSSSNYGIVLWIT